MKKLKYIFYILTTLLLVGCNDDEGYVYESLYDLAFTTQQPIQTQTNLATQATYNISKIKGKNNFYEFTIDQTANFTDFAINGQTFVANEFVLIDNFTDNNVITFTALSAGNHKLPVKIKYCGAEKLFYIDVIATTPTPGLALAVNAIKIQENSTTTNLGNSFNVNKYDPTFKFNVGDITLTDNLPGKTWELSITSALNNIDKITYRGVNYQPGEYFDFDPAYANELVITPKSTVTYGNEVFTFAAKNNDGTTSNTVEVPFTYYANITSETFNPNTTTTETLNSNTIYPSELFFDMESDLVIGTVTGGGFVSDIKLTNTKQFKFNGNGATITSVVLQYRMSATSDVRSIGDYSYTVGTPITEFTINIGHEIELPQTAGYAYTLGRITYTSTIKLIVTNEFGDTVEYEFENEGTFENTLYSFTGGL